PEPVTAEATEQAGQEDEQDSLDAAPADQAEAPPDPEPEQQAETEPEAPEEEPAGLVMEASIVIKEVLLLAEEGSLLLANVSAETVAMQGWFLCKRPDYWPIPNTELAPGQEIRIWVSSGDDTETDLFAARGYGTLGSSGEVALYSSGSFGDPSAMVAYVGWGNGGGRISEARQAGLWGDAFVQANAGDVICRLASGLFADGYQSMPAPVVDTPIDDDSMSAYSGFGPIAITRVYFDGHAMIELTNLSASAHSLDGYWLCQFPGYWPFPSGIEMPAGGTLFLNTGSGNDTADTLFVNGAIGELNASSGGEVALYRNNDFGNAASIASYVG
ncbi:MAG TPA: lamin tail domain-containing protein, partial [Dehalococcoidia bacterium]|nr:lamin tail domain-containing protein [Dehalococcoidia bacterium]